MYSVNLFAHLALLVWGPVCLAAFTMLRPPLACAVLMFGTVMFLPVGVKYDFGGVPPIGREELAGILILVAGLVRCRGRLLSASPGRGLEILVFVLMAGAIATAATNTDPLVYGPVHLPSIKIRDGVSDAIRDLLRYAVPFFIGRAFFRSQRDLRDLLLVSVVAGLIYTLPIFLELRLSPQLHRWTYGFFQHGFAGTVRYGGYRPMVYMTNGLALALFMATATIMSAAMSRAMRSSGRTDAIFGIPGNIRTLYLLAVLILCKSFASIGYGLLGSTMVSFLRPRTITRLASILVVLVTAYPMMRATDTFPTTGVLELAEAIDAERSYSLEYRFRNEDALLEKARERPAFGWGGFRRSRIFNDRGTDISTTDGYWIIMLGARGALGFVCTFGLLVVPVLLANRRMKLIASSADQTLVATLTLVVAIHALDLIPNGLFSYLPLFYSGALMGVLRGVKRSSTRQRPGPRPRPRTKKPSSGKSRLPNAPRQGDAAQSSLLGGRAPDTDAGRVATSIRDPSRDPSRSRADSSVSKCATEAPARAGTELRRCLQVAVARGRSLRV